jgi:hypothetical protein
VPRAARALEPLDISAEASLSRTPVASTDTARSSSINSGDQLPVVDSVLMLPIIALTHLPRGRRAICSASVGAESPTLTRAARSGGRWAEAFPALLAAGRGLLAAVAGGVVDHGTLSFNKLKALYEH